MQAAHSRLRGRRLEHLVEVAELERVVRLVRVRGRVGSGRRWLGRGLAGDGGIAPPKALQRAASARKGVGEGQSEQNGHWRVERDLDDGAARRHSLGARPIGLIASTAPSRLECDRPAWRVDGAGDVRVARAHVRRGEQRTVARLERAQADVRLREPVRHARAPWVAVARPRGRLRAKWQQLGPLGVPQLEEAARRHRELRAPAQPHGGECVLHEAGVAEGLQVPVLVEWAPATQRGRVVELAAHEIERLGGARQLRVDGVRGRVQPVRLRPVRIESWLPMVRALGRAINALEHVGELCGRRRVLRAEGREACVHERAAEVGVRAHKERRERELCLLVARATPAVGQPVVPPHPHERGVGRPELRGGRVEDVLHVRHEPSEERRVGARPKVVIDAHCPIDGVGHDRVVDDVAAGAARVGGVEHRGDERHGLAPERRECRGHRRVAVALYGEHGRPEGR